MNKKLLALLITILVVFSLCMVACEESHTHNYVEVAAKDPTCTQKGNKLYYTCSGCTQLFDADKNPIIAIPEVDAKGHTYVEHTACEAKCEQVGNLLYYTCANCDVIFDKDKAVIDQIPTTAALGHDYVNHAAVPANCTEGGNDEYYTCKNCEVIFDATKAKIDKIPTTAANGHSYAWTDAVENVSTLKCACGDVKGTVKVSVTTRLLVDVDATSLQIDVADFGTGLTVKSVKLGENTVTELTADGTKVTLATASLVKDVAHGDHNATIAVAIGDSATINVTLPVRVAHTISDVAGLKALYTVTAQDESYTNPVVGGTVVDGVVTPDWYVLTADIDGKDRLGGLAEYGNSDESWYTSGQAKQGFVGVFDGQNHTIKNFKILGHGFFGHVGCGTIKNVNFTNIELADGHTCLIGKLVDSTIQNVNVSNIKIGTLDANSGILGYHQFFSATLKDVDIDLTGITTATNVFAKTLDDSEMWEFDNSSFEDVTVKLDSTSGIKFFADKAVTDSLTGVTVSFVPFTVAKPVANTQDFYYTGSELTYTLTESPWYTITGNKQTAVGNHTVTVSLLDFEGISWADNTTDDVTFTFTILEMSGDKIAEFATAFAKKVTDLGTPVYPRDIPTIQSVLADYEALHASVKAHADVVTAKATLDGYKTECDKWEELTYAFTPAQRLGALSGDEFYLVIYNPTDAKVDFYPALNSPWTDGAHTELLANSWTQAEYPKTFASAGDVYLYVGGDHTKFITAGNGWILKIYGKEAAPVAPGTEKVVFSINDGTTQSINGTEYKVLCTDVKQSTEESWGTDLGGYFIKLGTISHTQIADLSKYENVYFYIFNPNEVAVQFFFQESKTWTALDSTTLAAKSWTKVSVSQLLSFDFTPTTDITNPLAYVDVNHAAHENFVYEGWMIPDFYGVAAE